MFKEAIKNANVPIQYNGDLLDNKLMFVTDYMILSLKGIPIVQDTNGLKFSPRDYGTAIFKDVLDVTIDGNIFGTISCSPRSPIVPFDTVHFKLENSLFYTKPGFQLLHYCNRLLNTLQIEFKGVNRLDLAVDYTDTSITKNVLTCLTSKSFRMSGRKKEVKFFSVTDTGYIDFQGVQIGKRTSSRFCRIYNKTLEMNTQKMKPYIANAWRSHGMQGEIWRFEYQLNSKFMSEIKGLTLNNLFQKDFLISLLEMARKNHFEIKFNTNKSEINKEKTFDFMPMSIIRELAKIPFLYVEKIKRCISESLIGQKRLIKGLMRGYASTGQNIKYLSPLKQILNDFVLSEWFFQKVGYYFDEFKKQQLSKNLSFTLFTKHFREL
ncbi:replication initiation factor [Cellulophaga phage phi18:4]|nr:replication initiation factor [Cellulophaga phage phi18:4]AGO49402.1 replication initiation factor [Cellulophaga phage phi48:1]